MAVSFRLFSLIRDIDNKEIDSNEPEEEADEIKDEDLEILKINLKMNK
ncbi:MAG: hypothetical protein Ct9H90mP2_07230 [Dehalococcoidia bacterium]|nr:MAG: hypothetical protein Ct9H90mP2_07230 [Dehalococcoidia bacterium]